MLSSDAVVLDNICAAFEQSGISHGRSFSTSFWLEAPGVFTYLVEEDAPFGFVTVGPPSLAVDDSVEGTGEILAWCVLPAWQGRGIGRKLLVHGLTVLKRRLCDEAAIWLSADSSRVINVVTKAGFGSTGVEKIMNSAAGPVKRFAYRRDLSDYF